ncbi:MAG: nucleotidyltransferase domain-containing protein [Planctomycetes bacterium]|nr:nucleotidyltransferase domain-containing protein [Planctomycetota bacterium]
MPSVDPCDRSALNTARDFTDIVELQSDLLTCTDWFLNGFDTHLWARPFPRALQKIRSGQYASLLPDGHRYLWLSPRKAAGLLASAWADFHEQKASAPAAPGDPGELAFSAAPWAASDDAAAGVPIAGMSRYLQEKVEADSFGFYIFGSYATRDYERDFSDLDAVLILRKESLENPEALLRIRTVLCGLWPFFLKIDPLQHHGLFIMGETNLDLYPDSIVPLCVLREGARQFGCPGLRIVPSSSLQRDRSALESTAGPVIEQAATRSCLKNMYALKLYLHKLLLLPAAYLQACGTPCYKRDSFPEVRRRFPQYDHIVDLIEEIRLEWPPVWRRVSTLVRIGRLVLNGHALRMACLFRLAAEPLPACVPAGTEWLSRAAEWAATLKADAVSRTAGNGGRK